MKSTWPIAISLLFSFIVTVRAQTQNWQWATGPAGQATILALCTDTAGNAYITGHFIGPLISGSDTLNDTLGPYQDVFTAKYNSSGNVLWVRNGSGYADAFGVTCDNDGNVYIAGDFYNNSINFGDTVLLNPNPGPLVSNIFFVKYDSFGNLLWAQNLGGINNDEAIGISNDATGNIYITGSFLGDSLRFGNRTLQHIADNDAFIAKFNPSGKAVWLKGIGSPFAAGSASVSTDGNQNVFVTGYFEGPQIFLDSTGNYINSPYFYNIFLTKYDSLGNMLWTKYGGGNNFNGPAAVSADALGNAYITGYFSDTIVFGNSAATGIGYQNIFITKYDASGTVLWVQSEVATGFDQSAGITTDARGNAYVTGYFQSDTVYFGNAQLLNTTGNQITFVVKYSPEGNADWAVAPGGTSNNTGAGISYANGSLYIAGAFQNADITFGSDTLSHALLEAYLAKSDTDLASGIPLIHNTVRKISVYPNPSGGTFYFAGLAGEDEITFYNILGQNVLAEISNRNYYPIDITGMAKGIYLYRISDENGIYLGSGKIVIQ